MKSEDGQIFLDGSYQQEGILNMENFKGGDAKVAFHKRKMGTYINELIQAGFTIESVIESDVSPSYDKVEANVSDRYYSLYKARKFPTTMIIIAMKR